MTPARSTDRALHRERLRVPVRWWMLWGLMVASFWLAMIAAIPGPFAWYATAAILGLMACLLRGYGSARIVVTEEWLRAGTARIERRHLGPAEALGAAQMRAVSGPEADGRAFLLLRPYISTGVWVRIDDLQDPTPYWLLSSRRPRALAEALATTPAPDTE